MTTIKQNSCTHLRVMLELMKVCCVHVRCTHLRPVPAFYLFTTPPKQRLRDDDREGTFLHAGLAPAALVHLAFEGTRLYLWSLSK
jgi:hypothetical protein